MLFKTQEQKFDNFVASNSKNKKIRLLIISYIVVGTFLTKRLYFCFLRYMYNIRYTQRKYPVGQKNSPLAYLSLSCPKEVLNVNAGVQSRQIWMRVPDQVFKLLMFTFFGPNVLLVLVSFSPWHLFGDNLTRPWVGCSCQFESGLDGASVSFSI